MSESFEEKVSDLVADLTRQRDAAWLQTENQKTRIGELLTALEKLHRERDEAREALSLANKSLQYCERVIDRLENSNFSLSSALKAINGNPTN